MFLLIKASKYDSKIVTDDYDVELWAEDRADIEQMKTLKELESKVKGLNFRTFKIVELDS
tara:strand:- start:48 stop:227 length:180 start_codon:yes stop_codon:yes gene_type:complete